MRELEARARASAAEPRTTPRRRRTLHPDQEEAVARITDAFGTALGADVDVKPRSGTGYRVELSFQSVDEALELARRLRLRAVA